MSKKIRGKNVKKVNEHFLGAKLVFCTEQVCYLLKKVIPKSVSKEKKEEYAKKYAKEYFEIDKLDCRPVFKKYKKAKSITLWVFRLIIPDFLIGSPNLWDNIKELHQHRYFKPLRIAVLVWLVFCVTILSSSIFSSWGVAEGEAA